MSLWNLLNRLVGAAVAVCLALTAYLQVERKDYIVWVPTFLVPSVLTFILSLRPRAVERMEVRAVISVHIGCCLCHLVYLATRLVHASTRESTPAFHLLHQPPPTASTNPFHHRETWECVAVVVVVAWLKFLTMTTQEHLREAGVSQTKVVSPRKMLRTLCLVFVAPLYLLWMCWMGGPPLWVAQATAHTAHDVLSVRSDRQLPGYNPVVQPLKNPLH